MLKKGAVRRCILLTTLKNRPADIAGVGAFGARNAGGHALARRLVAASLLRATVDVWWTDGGRGESGGA